MKLAYLLVVVAALSVAATQAIADGSRHVTRMLYHLDDDNDNRISIKEFQMPRGRWLDRADDNGDGAVTLKEMQNHFSAMTFKRDQIRAERRAKAAEKLASQFTTMDTNGNGSVTKEEAKLAIFAKMDEDNNGFISANEIKPPKRWHHHRADHNDLADQT